MERVSVSTPRRDKKKEIKASLPRSTRSVLEQRAVAVGLSPMAYAARLTDKALRTESVVRALTPYFRRGYVPLFDKSRAFMGRVIGPDVEPLLPEGGDVTRFPVKFLPEEHLHVGEVAYSLNCSLSQALTILLAEALLQGVEVESDARGDVVNG